MSDKDWHRLGRAAAARRHELGMSQQDIQTAGGPSTAAYGRIERGEERGDGSPMRASTSAKLERVFGWAPGSVDRVLAGGDPALALPPGTDGHAVVKTGPGGERLIIDIVNGVHELSDADRRKVLALINSMKQENDN